MTLLAALMNCEDDVGNKFDDHGENDLIIFNFR